MNTHWTAVISILLLTKICKTIIFFLQLLYRECYLNTDIKLWYFSDIEFHHPIYIQIRYCSRPAFGQIAIMKCCLETWIRYLDLDNTRTNQLIVNIHMTILMFMSLQIDKKIIAFRKNSEKNVCVCIIQDQKYQSCM